MTSKRLLVEPGSEAEKHFVKDLMPICKDEVKVFLGEIVGLNYNRYTISNEDYLRIRNYLKKTT